MLLHILMVFVQGEESAAAQCVFAVCLQAELVPASVQDYREKLLHLRKLRHDLVQRSLPLGPARTLQQVQKQYICSQCNCIYQFNFYYPGVYARPKVLKVIHVFKICLCLAILLHTFVQNTEM